MVGVVLVREVLSAGERLVCQRCRGAKACHDRWPSSLAVHRSVHRQTSPGHAEDEAVESALALHPAVHDVAVIGVPDEEMGQQVKACTALRGVPGPQDPRVG